MARKGFTLVELIIVMVVLGILATIAIPKFAESRRKALRATVLADLRGLASSQELYHGRHTTYTSNLTTLNLANSEGVVLTVNEATNLGWAATATHIGLGSDQCGVFRGTAAPSGGSPGTTPGVIECTF